MKKSFITLAGNPEDFLIIHKENDCDWEILSPEEVEYTLDDGLVFGYHIKASGGKEAYVTGSSVERLKKNLDLAHSMSVCSINGIIKLFDSPPIICPGILKIVKKESVQNEEVKSGSPVANVPAEGRRDV